MRALLALVVVLFVAGVAAAPPRVARFPLTHSELHALESLAREAHLDTRLTARDLHPLTPVLLAELDEEIPAFIVERDVVAAMVEVDDDEDMEVSDGQQTHEQAQMVEDSDEDDALIEAEFEISAPYGSGYGGYGGYGGSGTKGGYGGFGYGSKKVPYKKVPYKKVPYKKVPFKKAPPKKKLPPKKFPPKKKEGFGGFGFGFKKGGFGGGYGGFGGGGHH